MSSSEINAEGDISNGEIGQIDATSAANGATAQESVNGAQEEARQHSRLASSLTESNDHADTTHGSDKSNTIGEDVAKSAIDSGASSGITSESKLPESLQKLSINTGLTLKTGTTTEPVTSNTNNKLDPEKPYVDPTPRTPTEKGPVSQPPVPLDEKFDEKAATFVQDRAPIAQQDNKEHEYPQYAEGKESQGEIESIMDQFTHEDGGLGKDEIMSPRMELAGHHFPPRMSSLEAVKTNQSGASYNDIEKASSPPPIPPKSPPNRFLSPSPHPPSSPASVRAPPPPEPEPDLPFDFHRFLEQLRHRTADPVAKFLRSFLTEFGKRQWMVHEQVKIISDFLTFIANKMSQCEVWRDVSDAEFDNAKEGMEKLVMNRLYSQTFSPAIPLPPPPPRAKGKRKDLEKSSAPGRRGQHQEDVERDEILAQKIRIYSWVKEEHLDIPSVGPNGKRFLALAQQELLKIKGYRAPRDKVICVLNCCKVIFGLLRNSKSSDTSADSFVPLLIYVVLRANPEHLVSNIQYILRFRNQDKLGGEAGYYLSSLSGAIQFIESLDRTTLTVSDDEFERNVEKAVSEIAERTRLSEDGGIGPAMISEKAPLAGPEVTPRNSMEAEQSSPRKRFGNSSTSTDGSEDSDAVAGLLRTIQKPLSTIGRIFSDEGSTAQRSQPVSTLQPGATPRLSPNVFQPPPRTSQEGKRTSQEDSLRGTKLSAEEAAARQASAESAEAQKIQRAEHKNVVETLYGMFPNLDRDVIDDVVRMKEGRVGLAVDACLALSAGS
ncbi:MAG: hypothetical protein Q9227_006698 [Pyrenula ochraceoflavens]